MRVTALAFAVVVLLGGSAPSHADDEKGKEAARKLLAEGDLKLSLGDKRLARGDKAEAQDDYLAALASYNKAYESYPNAKIYFAIGLAEKKLGRFVEALEHFDQFLREATTNEQLRSKVEEHTEEIKMFLGVIFFRVVPDGAVVEIDGKRVGKTPLNQPHYVPPGEHEYQIRKKGFKSANGSVEVEAGEARNDEIVLELDVEQSSSDDDDDDDDDDDEQGPPSVVTKAPPVRSKKPLIVGFALTGTFALAATVSGLVAVSKHNTFEDPLARPEDRDSARSSGKNLALATDVFAIGAVAAATYTVYYYFVEYKASPAQEDKGVAAAPWVSSQSAGLAIGGRF